MVGLDLRVPDFLLINNCNERARSAGINSNNRAPDKIRLSTCHSYAKMEAPNPRNMTLNIKLKIAEILTLYPIVISTTETAQTTKIILIGYEWESIYGTGSKNSCLK